MIGTVFDVRGPGVVAVSIRTHDQRKEQQPVSIDLIWGVASFGAYDV